MVHQRESRYDHCRSREDVQITGTEDGLPEKSKPSREDVVVLFHRTKGACRFGAGLFSINFIPQFLNLVKGKASQIKQNNV